MTFYSTTCPRCGGKLEENIWGQRYCPVCKGREMSRKGISKICPKWGDRMGIFKGDKWTRRLGG